MTPDPCPFPHMEVIPLSKIVDLIKAEPVRVVAAVQSTLAAAVLFGLALSPEQLAGLVIAVAAWLAVVTRSQVTPTPAPLGEKGATTVAEVCLVILVCILVAWAFGYVPTNGR